VGVNVTLSSSTLTPLSAIPDWWSLALLTAFALAVTWLVRRISRARTLVGARRWAHVAQVLTWTCVAVAWAHRTMPEDSAHGLVGVGLLLVAAIAALPWLRDLFHALVFSFEGRFRTGDHLRVGDTEGCLVAIGPRAIVLRAVDGTEITIPHTKLAEASVVRLNLDARDAPSELLLTAPAEVDVDTAVELARIAAALSPYAAPRMEPSVFVVHDRAARGVRLRLRGFVFDREYEALYRSDVGARFLRLAHERVCSHTD